MVDYGSLLVAEKLRLRGSNFVNWYLRLREVLHTNAELYVLDEPLAECPKNSARDEEYMEWFLNHLLESQVDDVHLHEF